MNLQQSNLQFRRRTQWEAVDLGRRLVSEHFGYYMALTAALILPFVVLLGVLLHSQPALLLFCLWWLKPLFEYGVLAALATQAFAPLPPLKQSIKTGYRLMLRRRVLADLTWRRFRPFRSFHLPIQQLEQLSGKPYRKRCRELGRYGNATASSLTYIGSTLEGIWLYGLMILSYWLLYGDFIRQGLVQPSQGEELSQLRDFLYNLSVNGDVSSVLQYHFVAYALVLAFWLPFYVGGGFTLYLNARTQAEAWDIRLIWQGLGERLRKAAQHGAKLCFTCGIGLLAAWSLLASEHALAETLPDAAQIEQHKQVLQQKPFYHVETNHHWCWRSCDAAAAEKPSPRYELESVNTAWMQPLAYVLFAVLLISVLYLLWRWWAGGRGLDSAQRDDDGDAPMTLFGLDIQRDSLPPNVSQEALQLLAQDPRAALSLLYRASLAQLIHRYRLPLKHHHTENQVLQLTQSTAPDIADFVAALTAIWLRTAYGHKPTDITQIRDLCQRYAAYFETGARS